MRKIEDRNVLLVSHDMGTVKQICDVGIVAHNAKLHYFKDINMAIDMYTEDKCLMELVYLWVEDYKNIKKQGLIFHLDF